ncbi:hypothetical protein Tco_0585842 [Tanacetum coccineum]
MGAKDCCLMGLRKKRCGASLNEDLLTDVGRLWCKVEGCGGVLDVVVAAAEVSQQGGDVANFRAMECTMVLVICLGMK